MIVEYETQGRTAVNVMAQLAAVGIWLVLMAGAMLIPTAAGSLSAGDDRLRFAIHVSLAFYFAACTGMLVMPRALWRSDGADVRTARLLWSLAWLSYLVHVFLSFQHCHHWSHAHAIAHTREVSGFGEGIFVTHFFTLLWTADVVFWWLSADHYVRRPRWLGWTIHGFMAFIMLNGAVVYVSGSCGWVVAAVFAWLATMLAFGAARVRSSHAVAPKGLPS